MENSKGRLMEEVLVALGLALFFLAIVFLIAAAGHGLSADRERAEHRQQLKQSKAENEQLGKTTPRSSGSEEVERPVRVLTASGKPTIYVPSGWDAIQIDKRVEQQYGRQSNGLPHNWYGYHIPRD